jgi:hypothetical protein
MARLTEIPENIHAAVTSATKQLRARYRMVEYADIQQELYLWYIQHHHKVAEWEEQYHPKTAERFLVKSLKNHGDKYCRKEKAELEGYEIEDEFFYSIPLVADMLQLYFDPDRHAPRGIELGKSPSGAPPEEGGNLMAMVADVGKAYEAMPPTDQWLLSSVYDGEIPVREAIANHALEWGITHGAADRRIRRVLGRLRTKLGGPRPYVED